MYTEEEKDTIFAYYAQYQDIGLPELTTLSESEFSHVLGIRGLAHGLQQERPYINEDYKNEVFARSPVTSRRAIILRTDGAFLIRVNDDHQQVGKELLADWKFLRKNFPHWTSNERTDEGDGIWLLSAEEWRAALPKEPKEGILTTLKKAIFK